MSQLVPFLNFGLEESVQYPESDLMYGFDSAFDKSKMYITLEGLNSGVPTRTTPTLTPTTLRNIEQTFIELQSKPEPHENEAGFVPPLVQIIGNGNHHHHNHHHNHHQYSSLSSDDVYSSGRSQSLWQSSLSQSSSSDSNAGSTPPPQQPSPPQRHGGAGAGAATTTTPSRRNMGGRRPAKDVNVSPEEEERRRVRRERNKAAAARCRKRRVDHTNSLIRETEDLEEKKREMERQIDDLNNVRDELEFLLHTHRGTAGACRLRAVSPPDVKPPLLTASPQHHHQPPHHHHQQQHHQAPHHHHQQHQAGGYDHLPKIKTEDAAVAAAAAAAALQDDMFPLPSAKRVMLSQAAAVVGRPSRPSTLNVGPPGGGAAAAKGGPACPAEIAGVPISTPSAGLQFNFDSLMGGGTGLTPVSAPLVPSCSSQQRHLPPGAIDIMSPDACGPVKLVSL